MSEAPQQEGHTAKQRSVRKREGSEVCARKAGGKDGGKPRRVAAAAIGGTQRVHTRGAPRSNVGSTGTLDPAGKVNVHDDAVTHFKAH